MFLQKLKKAVLGISAVSALVVGLGTAPAHAAVVILDAWKFMLGTSVNGTTYDGGSGLIGGANNLQNIDHLVVSGLSTVTQTLAGGSPFGQVFHDSGFLQILGETRENPPGGFLALNAGSNTANATPNTNVVYLQFVDLTGVFNADGTITFDPSSGKVKLWLDNTLDSALGPDPDFNPANPLAKLLAVYDLLPPSGGSDLNFYGGGGANAHVDITLKQTSGIAGLFLDSSGAALSTLVLHLVNVDALVDPNFTPNPLYSGGVGCDPATGGSACTSAIFHAQNAGQYNLAIPVPEPSTLSFLGFGLIGLAFAARRRTRKAA